MVTRFFRYQENMTNLEFLNLASNEDLRVLCDIILKDKDGKFRITENLSSTEVYKKNYPNNIKGMLPELIAEFRLFGGNSIINLFRGNGPEYTNILRNVADKNKVNYNANSTDEMVEQYLLQKLFADSLDKASDEELKSMMEELGYPTTNFGRQAAIVALTAAFRAGGFNSYILLVSVVNAVVRFIAGRGLSLVANAALTRVASVMVGPVGLALTAAWTLFDVAGPAYRVIVPAVIQIAYIRQTIKNVNGDLL